SDNQISDSMRFCRAEHKSQTLSDHSCIAISDLRIIPSPEHGASNTITSNKSGVCEKSAGSEEVIKTFGFPQRVIFSSRILTRFFITSLATNTEPLGILSAISVVLPPGAAAKSKMYDSLNRDKNLLS